MYKKQMTNQSNNDGLSFYEDLNMAENYTQEIVLSNQEDTLQKHFINNQKLITEDQFILVDPISRQYQKMLLTNYRLIIKKDYIQSIPYGYIQEFKALQKFIRLILKTGLFIDLYLDDNQQKLQQSLSKALSLVPFCFICQSERELPCIYDSYAQIQRMRVDSRLYSVFKNVAAKFCSTYPLYFLVPKGVEVSNLNEIKRCRFMSRIPILSYYNERTNVGIWRAAKRKNEISQQVKKFDVYYIRSIPGNLIVLQIEQNSFAKGNLSFQSLQSLKTSFFNLTKTYNLGLQFVIGSKLQLYKVIGKWYDEIDKLISLAYNAVDFINQGQQVLLEETYGLDRVSQVLVLTEIIMDPFFRTFDGLSIIIQKQFISYGHPFEERCGLKIKKQQQISPIFIQLLECIHQLVVTHPSCFQFTSSYLSRIAYEVYTTKYKNFMNKNRDTQKQNSYNKCCMGLWEGLSVKRKANPQFNRNTKRELWEIRKRPSIKQYMIWVDYYDLVCKMDGEKN